MNTTPATPMPFQRLRALLRALLCALVLPAPAFLPGCMTNPATGETEPDWPLISRELQLIEGDLLDLASLVDQDRDGDGEPDQPEAAAQLRELAGHTRTVKRGVDAYIAGGGPQGAEVFAAIDAALELADQLLDRDAEERVYVAAARMLARRIQAYLPRSAAEA